MRLASPPLRALREPPCALGRCLRDGALGTFRVLPGRAGPGRAPGRGESWTRVGWVESRGRPAQLSAWELPIVVVVSKIALLYSGRTLNHEKSTKPLDYVAIMCCDGLLLYLMLAVSTEGYIIHEVSCMPAVDDVSLGSATILVMHHDSLGGI